MNKLEFAAMLKEDAENTDNPEYAARLLTDHYKIMAEEADGYAAQRYLQEMYNTKCLFEGCKKKAEKDPEVKESHVVDTLLVTTHDVTEGCTESDKVEKVKVKEDTLSKLGITPVTEGYSQTIRVIVTDVMNESKADLHAYYNGDDKCLYVRSIDESNESLIESFKNFIAESVDKVEAWKKEVESTHPEHVGNIKYASKIEVGANHISADLRGHDRSLGFFDLDKEEGHVLHESVEVMKDDVDGKVIRHPSRDDKVWYDSSRLWNHHLNQLKLAGHVGELGLDGDGNVTRRTDADGHTVALYDTDKKQGWIRSELADKVIKKLEEVKEEPAAQVHEEKEVEPVDGVWDMFKRKDPNKATASPVSQLAEGNDSEFKAMLSNMLTEKVNSKFEEMKLRVAKAM
jgi:hypothetical protein